MIPKNLKVEIEKKYCSVKSLAKQQLAERKALDWKTRERNKLCSIAQNRSQKKKEAPSVDRSHR